MKQLRDKNGLTEQEFLKAYDASRFERPSLTVDIVLFTEHRVLLIRRGGHPFLGKLALPGGFVEPNETVAEAAKRELYEETNLTDVALKQLPVFSEPHRDPRTRIVTVPFLAYPQSGIERLCAGDDASDAAFWEIAAEDRGDRLLFNLQNGEKTERFAVRRLIPDGQAPFPPDVLYTAEKDSPLAGDHGEILACAWDRLMHWQNGQSPDSVCI